MPKAEGFAREIVLVCVACCSLAWTPSAIGALTVRMPSLARLGRAYWSKCPVGCVLARTIRRARSRSAYSRGAQACPPPVAHSFKQPVGCALARPTPGTFLPKG